ncbi:hypothetical protein [Ralstonia solanacearum]|uniref:hypothetical protein n=1 Tax=Ralstonia solanacearum TaxID=305 RepID=UPI0009EC59DB|nr:hypothetical protein [Ralstonia solanacearum]AXV89224.1 hypothetical protein CJO78_23555 [Ralstonia solanacearum]AXW08688.1 hypothetical protein CJO82_23225 [Ralstonia solanacearum]AXW26471.1 hypothetical protein CJO86_23495 [Ralstonia solanacearum]AXW83387.1 hypothetical protein CJO98_23585 [Ralstonia solanacearum]
MDDDLTAADAEHILAICRALVDCAGCVLHGSPVKPALCRLEPRQANDAAKLSGNQCAVYAGVVPEAVLMHAVIDRAYLSSRFASYRLGYRFEGGRCVFRVTGNVLDLVRQSDSRLCTNGFVYALDRAFFQQSLECAAEFFSLRPVVPLRRLQVPAGLGLHLLSEGAVETLAPCGHVR